MAEPQDKLVEKIAEKIRKDPAKAASIGATFVLTIRGEGGGSWTLRLVDPPSIESGVDPKADCTLELDAVDWHTIQASPPAAMQLFFQGKIKVSGNPMLAAKLQPLFG